MVQSNLLSTRNKQHTCPGIERVLVTVVEPSSMLHIGAVVSLEVQVEDSGERTSSMWFKKCTGVSTELLPVPSRSIDTATCVSFVLRSTWPVLAANKPQLVAQEIQKHVEKCANSHLHIQCCANFALCAVIVCDEASGHASGIASRSLSHHECYAAASR